MKTILFLAFCIATPALAGGGGSGGQGGSGQPPVTSVKIEVMSGSSGSGQGGNGMCSSGTGGIDRSHGGADGN